ncbi:hypothetical protein EV426DRAFT_620989 [Tirmania nivea]|nr:hypothetical protein EV426DRAFT_620989 [Tirmania nivea]
MSPATNIFPRSDCRNARIPRCSLLTADRHSGGSGLEDCDDWVNTRGSCSYSTSSQPSVSRAGESTEPCEFNEGSGTGQCRYLATRDVMDFSLVDLAPERNDPSASTRGHQRKLSTPSPSITRYLENTIDDGPWNPAATTVQARRIIFDMPSPAEADSHFIARVPTRDLLIFLDSITTLISTDDREPHAFPATYLQPQPEEASRPRSATAEGIAHDGRAHSSVRRAQNSEGASSRYGPSMSYDLTGLKNPQDLSWWVEHGSEDGVYGVMP